MILLRERYCLSNCQTLKGYTYYLMTTIYVPDPYIRGQAEKRFRKFQTGRVLKNFRRGIWQFILPSSTSINLGVGLVVVQANNSGSGSGSRRLAFLLPLNWASLPLHYHYFLSLFRPPKIVVVEVQAGPIKWQLKCKLLPLPLPLF